MTEKITMTQCHAFIAMCIKQLPSRVDRKAMTLHFMKCFERENPVLFKRQHFVNMCGFRLIEFNKVGGGAS